MSVGLIKDKDFYKRKQKKKQKRS